MFEKLKKIENRYKELEDLLVDPKVIQDKNLYQQYVKEISVITGAVNNYRHYNRLEEEIKELEEFLGHKDQDKDFLEMTRHEIQSLKQRQEEIRANLEKSLEVKDDSADKDIIVEIRAGTGGNEAGLFAADLYRMYTKYALKMGWTVEAMSSSPTDLGGVKEIIFAIKGKDVFRRLKFESGVHRVQRVPATEASGRIHTSTATVAIMTEPDDIELKIEPADIKVDVYRASGHGGQGVNTTDSAVRITYLPTGMVVTCQDERSQMKNKVKAMRVLRARLLEQMHEDEVKRLSKDRMMQIGTGDRSEKIRTYNFPDRRITDHRIGLTLYKFDSVLNGELDELTDALIKELNK